MASKHLDDPLDYLYEDLPDAEMAEVRGHLAECPQCREEIARVRAAVKLYRSASRPLPPVGLAKRVAAAALEAVKADATGEEGTPPPKKPVAHVEDGGACAGNKPGSGKTRWLFHPAWTVAASIILIFTILYHISPRRAPWNGGDARLPAVSETSPDPDAARNAGVRERRRMPLPESRPRNDESLPDAPPAAAFSVTKMREQPAPIPGTQPNAAEHSAFAAPVQEKSEGFETEAAQSMALPPPEKESVGIASPSASLRPPAPAALPPAPAASPAEATAVPFETSLDAKLFGEREEKDRRRFDDDAAPGESVSISDLEELNALLDAAPDDGPAVVDLTGGMEPPRLLPRLPEVDVEKLARDLIFMAGMQMGNGELEEAGITIGLLRKYDPEKALELDGILASLLKEKEKEEGDRAGAGAEGEREADDVEPFPEGRVDGTAPASPDKYFRTPNDEGGNMAPKESAPRISIGVPDEVPPSAAPGGEPSVSPAPTVESGPEDIPRASDSAEPPIAVETPPEHVRESVDAGAPDVPKESPDAIPPTLWENAVGSPPAGRGFSVSAREPSRRVFTTDPYYRGR